MIICNHSVDARACLKNHPAIRTSHFAAYFARIRLLQPVKKVLYFHFRRYSTFYKNEFIF